MNPAPEVAENTLAVGTYAASDPDAGDTLTYTLSGADAALFAIGADGALAFAAAPDFEAPQDANGDNQYEVTVTATDTGGLSDSVDVVVSVSNANDVAPAITSDATGAPLAENTEVDATTPVYTAAGTFDVDPIVWSLKAGEGDEALFAIDAATGAVTFRAATMPDFEAQDSYTFTLVATSGDLPPVEQAVTIDVTDIDEAPSPDAARQQVNVQGLLFTLKADAGDAITQIYFSTTTSSPTASVSGTVGGLVSLNIRANPDEVDTLDELIAFLLADADVTNNFDLMLDDAADGSAPIDLSDADTFEFQTFAIAARARAQVHGLLFEANEPGPDGNMFDLRFAVAASSTSISTSVTAGGRTRITYNLVPNQDEGFAIKTLGELVALFEADSDVSALISFVGYRDGAGADDPFGFADVFDFANLGDDNIVSFTGGQNSRADAVTAPDPAPVRQAAIQGLVFTLKADAVSSLEFEGIDFSSSSTSPNVQASTGNDRTSLLVRPPYAMLNTLDELIAFLRADSDFTDNFEVMLAPDVEGTTAFVTADFAGQKVDLVETAAPEPEPATQRQATAHGLVFTLKPDAAQIERISFNSTTSPSIVVGPQDGVLSLRILIDPSATTTLNALIALLQTVPDVTDNVEVMLAPDADGDAVFVVADNQFAGSNGAGTTFPVETVEAATPTPIDTPSFGTVAIAYDEQSAPDDAANVGETLTADISGLSDPDDSALSFAYQWQRDGVDIAGATAATYVADAPGDYTVVVTAGDDVFNVDTPFTSAPLTVAAATPANSAPAYQIGTQVNVQGLVFTLKPDADDAIGMIYFSTSTASPSVSVSNTTGGGFLLVIYPNPDEVDTLNELIAFLQTYSDFTDNVEVVLAPGVNGDAPIDLSDENTFKGQTFSLVVGVNPAPEVAENSLAVGTYTASDPEGDALSYTLSGDDAALFAIGADGALAFAAAPDFEAPQDADTDNQYEVTVTATDTGGLSDSVDVVVSVSNANEVGPTITSGATGAPLAENTEIDRVTPVYTATGTFDADPIAWSLKAGGGDQALFKIDVASGEVTFISVTTPDFEAKDSYTFTIVATSGDQPLVEQEVTIAVVKANSAPAITTAERAYDVAEGETAVARLTADEADAVWQIVPAQGDDAALFTIGADGALAFAAAPDFEAPGDGDTDNVYTLQVQAVDGSDPALVSDPVTLVITVINANDVAPTITSAAAGAPLAENTEVDATTVLYTATGTFDVDPIVWSLKAGAGDEALFAIDAASGAVTFRAAVTPDFETQDSYTFTVVATSGDLPPVEQAVTIGVSNANDVAPTITSGAIGAPLAENTEVDATMVLYTATGTFDVDPIVWSLKSGAGDGLFFDIDANTGEVTSRIAITPDFEARDSYTFTIVATSGDLPPVEQEVTIAVSDVNEAPIFLIGAQANVNGLLFTLEPSPGIAAEVISFLFSVETPKIIFITLEDGRESLSIRANPDEITTLNQLIDLIRADGTIAGNLILSLAPGVDGDAPIDLRSSAFDGTQFDLQTGANLSPEIPENTLAVGTYAATDPDAGDTLTYTLSGADAALFTIGDDGSLAFAAAPDFEAPQDANGDNQYEVTVTATDSAGLTANLDVAINVTNVDEPAANLRAVGVGSVAENSEAADTGIDVLIDDVDTDIDAAAFTITGTDAEKFELVRSARNVFDLRLKSGESLDFDEAGDASQSRTLTIAGPDATSVDVVVAVTDVDETPAPATRQQVNVQGLVFTLKPDAPEPIDEILFSADTFSTVSISTTAGGTKLALEIIVDPDEIDTLNELIAFLGGQTDVTENFDLALAPGVNGDTPINLADENTFNGQTFPLETVEDVAPTPIDVPTFGTVAIAYDEQSAPDDAANVGETLTADISGLSDPDDSALSFAYQWQRDGVDIAGATAATYVADAPGDYTVVVTAGDDVFNVDTPFTSAPLTVAAATPANSAPAYQIGTQVNVQGLVFTLKPDAPEPIGAVYFSTSTSSPAASISSTTGGALSLDIYPNPDEVDTLNELIAFLRADSDVTNNFEVALAPGVNGDAPIDLADENTFKDQTFHWSWG